MSVLRGSPHDPRPPLLMAVDGNSLLHRAHHAHLSSDQRDLERRPTWALRGLLTALGAAAERLGADALLVAFDSVAPLERVRRYPDYKAGRPPKPAALVEQLAVAPALLVEAGMAVVCCAGHEADDVLASAAERARESGWRCTVVTSDRDAFALIDPTTSVLRVINGGIDASPLLTPERLPILCGIRAGQYLDFAALRGDTSDNLPGVRGIGAKTAARLLASYDGVAQVLAALDSGRRADVEAAVGAAGARRLDTAEARTNLARNLELMAMRTDLPVPPPETLRLPLDPTRLHAALRGRDIRLGRSLWALTEGMSADDAPAPALRPPVERRTGAATTARSRDASGGSDEEQLSLF